MSDFKDPVSNKQFFELPAGMGQVCDISCIWQQLHGMQQTTHSAQLPVPRFKYALNIPVQPAKDVPVWDVVRTLLNRLRQHKGWMLFPAIAWLFIQFSMSGVMLSSSADAMQIEICSPFGIQQISIDPETGEPAEPAVGSGCDWCQSFGVVTDTGQRANVPWSAFECDHTRQLPTIAPMHTPLRLVADFRSRAPPLL